MKRKNKVAITISGFIIIAFSLTLLSLPRKITNNPLQKQSVYPTEKKKNQKAPGLEMSFVVVSDIHVSPTNLESQVKFSDLLNDYILKPNAMVVVGDLGDGEPSTYSTLSEELLIYRSSINYPIFWTIGNHDFYVGFYKNRKWSPQTFPNGETDSLAISNFLTFAGRNKVYGDSWIKGYHFIFLGSEKSRMSNVSYKDNAYLSNNQLDWLKKALSKNGDPHKPIFLFLHQPFSDTVTGSGPAYSQNNIIQAKELREILIKYPQIIMFSGHTHSELTLPKMIFNNGFTMVNDGAIESPWDMTEKEVQGSAQGLVVQVYNTKVEIKGRDFKKGEWLSNCSIDIKGAYSFYNFQL